MSIQHFSWGKGVSGGASGVLVRYRSADGSTTSVDLGYTRDGVDLAFETLFGEIKSDDFGGEEGDVADMQLLGTKVMITTELSKYERSEMEKLETFDFDGATSAFGGTAGTMAPSIGSFVFQDSLYGILDLVGPSKTLRFSHCVPVKRDGNRGVKATMETIQWRARINTNAARKLFEEVTTS